MYSTVIWFYVNFVTLLFLACVDGGLPGTGKTQGTCADGEVCTSLGECLGRSLYSNYHYFQILFNIL